MTFGAEGADEQTAFRMLDRYFDAGGNYLDTANNYGGSEEIIGRWLKARGLADSMVVATKVRFPIGSGPNDVGLTRKHIYQAVHLSLRRLQTECIDLYQAHCWDHMTALEETLHALDDLIGAGKVRYIGCSNFTAWRLIKALGVSERSRWASFVNIQSQYSLLCRSPEWEILPACISEGIGFTAWSPLAAGWLSGKYRRDAVPSPDSRIGRGAGTMEEWERLQEADTGAIVPHPRRIESRQKTRNIEQELRAERRWHIIDAVGDVARAHGKSASQIALAWILAQDGVTAPVIGCRTLSQLEDNLGAADVRLEPGELTWLNDLSDPGQPYPHDFLNQYGGWR
jgi:aryl-alcohol dehydrogenase-like predicted oxidoreductase